MVEKIEQQREEIAKKLALIKSGTLWDWEINKMKKEVSELQESIEGKIKAAIGYLEGPYKVIFALRIRGAEYNEIAMKTKTNVFYAHRLYGTARKMLKEIESKK